MKVHLTQSLIDRFKTVKAKENLLDTELPGLLCEVTATGKKSFYIIFTDEYSRQRQKKVGDGAVMSVKQARTLARELLVRIKTEGTSAVYQERDLRACPTFAEFFRSRYVEHARATKRSVGTDISMFNNHLLPAFGKMRMAEIRPEDIERFYQQDLERGAARGSANRRIILIRYIFNLAIRWEIPGVTKNPASALQLPSAHNKRERFLDSEEMVRLQKAVEASENRMLRYIVPALLLTGMRKREVLDAKWEDIDLENRTWYLPNSKTGPRKVNISDALAQLLQALPRRPSCDFAFANPSTGKPFVSIFYSWDSARKRAGLPEVRIHDLRHTFASMLINSDYGLYDVMNLLGHTQMKTTMRYAHLADSRKRAAVNAVAQQSGLVAVLPLVPPANSDSLTEAA